MTFAWNAEAVETVKRLWAEGLSASRIGDRLGISRNAVLGKLRKVGAPQRLQPQAGSKPPPRSGKARRPIRLPQVLSVRSAAPEAVMGLRRNQCRYAYGDPKSDHFGFCPERRGAGHSYCTEHLRLVYQPARRKEAA